MTDKNIYTVAVVGGGAAGMAAAVSAAESAPSVLCLERKDEPGRKLLATGSGRCNFSNAACAGHDDVLRLFRELGLFARREEDGRFYPFARQAAVVRDALREEMTRRGVVLHCNAPVKSLRRAGEGTKTAAGAQTDAAQPKAKARPCFEIETEDGALFRAEKLVIATGGKAGPQYGSLGDGYAFARRFGHEIVSPLPSLVRMVCAETERRRLSMIAGVRAKCEAALWIENAPAGRAVGEVQFTEEGLSGICIMDLSRYMRMKGAADVCRVVLDLAPTVEEGTLRALFADRKAAYLSGVLHEKLAALVETETKGSARVAARKVKTLSFFVDGTMGWSEAQVTSGGVPLCEIDADTMESKRAQGLFFAGEVLDYDGPCGGYNLNWAFLTGIKAGRAAAGMAVDA
jgi:predicted Rossmann fold flavoprotein